MFLANISPHRSRIKVYITGAGETLLGVDRGAGNFARREPRLLTKARSGVKDTNQMVMHGVSFSNPGRSSMDLAPSTKSSSRPDTSSL